MSAAKAKLQARFDLAICRQCKDKNRCPVLADERDGDFARSWQLLWPQLERLRYADP